MIKTEGTGVSNRMKRKRNADDDGHKQKPAKAAKVTKEKKLTVKRPRQSEGGGKNVDLKKKSKTTQNIAGHNDVKKPKMVRNNGSLSRVRNFSRLLSFVTYFCCVLLFRENYSI